MALGFIKKVFSFGKDKAETGEKPLDDSAPAKDDALSSFEEVLHEAEATAPLADDPVLAVEVETAGGPSPDDVAVDLNEDEAASEEEDAPILPGSEQVGEIGMVPSSPSRFPRLFSLSRLLKAPIWRQRPISMTRLKSRRPLCRPLRHRCQRGFRRPASVSNPWRLLRRPS